MGALSERGATWQMRSADSSARVGAIENDKPVAGGAKGGAQSHQAFEQEREAAGRAAEGEVSLAFTSPLCTHPAWSKRSSKLLRHVTSAPERLPIENESHFMRIIPILARCVCARAGTLASTVTAMMFAVLAALALVALGVGTGMAQQISTSSCSGKTVAPGQDLDAIVNADAKDRATTFCVTAGTYSVDSSVQLREGDALIGERGTLTQRGPAVDPDPVVTINNGSGLSRLVTITGTGSRLEWVRLQGAKGKYVKGYRKGDRCRNPSDDLLRCPKAGSGRGVSVADNVEALIEHVEVSNNEVNGIGGGATILESDISNNGTNPDFAGFTAAGVKADEEYEVARSYIHDNKANGLWCDSGCSHESYRPSGLWWHHNLITDNTRWGARYEHSPQGLAPGVHQSPPTATIARNEMHGNGKSGSHGGISVQDAQNTTVSNNNFGPATIAGVSYAANGNKISITFGDSGREERTDLWNGDTIDNTLNGETVNGCQMPDAVVACSGNTP